MRQEYNHNVENVLLECDCVQVRLESMASPLSGVRNSLTVGRERLDQLLG